MRLIDAIIKVKIFANGIGFIDHKPINPEKMKIKVINEIIIIIIIPCVIFLILPTLSRK